MNNTAIKILKERRSELEDRLEEAKNVVNLIKADIESIDKAIHICSPEYKIEVAGVKKSKRRIFKTQEFKSLVFGFLREQDELVDTEVIVSFLEDRKNIKFSEDYTKREFTSSVFHNLLYYSKNKTLCVEKDVFGTPCKWGIAK